MLRLAPRDDKERMARVEEGVSERSSRLFISAALFDSLD